MKALLFTLLISISIPIHSRVYNIKLSEEYATLSLITNTMEWKHSNTKIVMSMKVRKYKTQERINKLWKEMN